MNPHRLWPVVLVLALLLGGVARLEWVASHHDPTFVEIVVSNAGVADEETAETVSDQSWQASPPTSPDHARARQLVRRGELDTAIEIYRELVGDEGAPVPMLTEFAYALRQAQRCDEAEAAVDQAVVDAPDDGSVQLSRALVLRCLNRRGEAEEAFERAMALRPNHSPTRLAYAEFLQRDGQHQRAIRVLTPASETGSNDERARALARLGRCLFDVGDRTAGRVVLEEAVERAPQAINIWVDVARAYLTSDETADLEAALSHATLATRLAPDVAEPYSIAARALEKLDRPLEAIDQYRVAAQLDESYEYVRTRLVRLGLAEDEPSLARRAARELLEIDDTRSEYHFLMGLATSRGGDAEEARESYLRAMEVRGGQHAEAAYNLGILERDLGNLEASKAAYLAAIDARPEDEEAWKKRGLVHHDLGEFGEAEVAFREAAARRPSYSSAWINLGRTYAAQNDYVRAAEALERALAISPWNRTARLRLAVAYRRTERLDEAVAAYRALVRDEPRYVGAWYNLGIAVTATGDTDAALEAYTTAIEIDPNHAGSLKNLGLLEAQLGNGADAWVHLNDALDHEPGDPELRLAIAGLAIDRNDGERCLRETENVLAQVPDLPEALAIRARCPAP